VRIDTHKYIEYRFRGRELYDLHFGPYELENITKEEGTDPELIARLETRSKALKDRAGEACRIAEDSP
jgi:hypothetical protein